MLVLSPPRFFKREQFIVASNHCRIAENTINTSIIIRHSNEQTNFFRTYRSPFFKNIKLPKGVKPPRFLPRFFNQNEL